MGVAFCAMLLPGFLVVLPARVPFATAIGLSGAVSASVLAVSAVVAPYLGLGWNPGTVALGTFVAALLTFLVRLLMGRFLPARASAQAWTERRTPGRELAALAAAAVAGCFIAYRFVQMFQQPGFLSQTADNIFHLNLVRYMQETDNASALAAGGVQGAGPAFYPSVWHSAVNLVAESAQVSIPYAANAVNIVIGAVVWPLGALFLTRVLFGSRPILLFGAAVSASAFSAYPYLLLDWGVLYPNFYAMALVLPALGLGVLLLRGWRKDRSGVAVNGWLVLLLCPGLAVAHPNALLVLMVALLPLVTAAWFAWAKPLLARTTPGAGRRAVLAAGAGAAGAAAWLVVWIALRPLPVADFANTWQPYESTAQAVGEVLLTTHAAKPSAWATAVLVAAGAAALLRLRDSRWLVAGYVLIGILFVFAAGGENSPLRTFLTGGWYDDQNRLAAAVAVLGVPLAAKGAAVLADLAAGVLRRVRVPVAASAAVAAVAVLGAAFLVSQDTAVRPTVQKGMKAYSLDPHSDIMSTNEEELFEQIESIVPEDAAVAGNPWDGAAWVYLVSGRTAVFPHVQFPRTPERELIASKLRDAASDPEVCDALEELNVEYAVTSDELIYLPGNPAHEEFVGMDDLDEAPGFERVAQVGGVELFRITACG